MKICLVSPGPEFPPVAAAVTRLAELLTGPHEVAVVEPPAELSDEARALTFSCEAHRRSAGVMEAIRERYGEAGPDYLEVADRSPLGFVPLQARLGGDPLLARTVVGVRASPSGELLALHDYVLDEPEHLRLAELERWQLRQADFLVWPGGDLLGLYRCYYAGLELPPERLIPPAPAPAPRVAAWEPPGPEQPLRILYLGELQRSRGVTDLLEACLSLGRDDWRLTIAGPDTATATMGQSVRASLEAMAGADPRLVLLGSADRNERDRLLADADLLALPGRVEGLSEDGITALRGGVPLLATPVGGVVELVAEGMTGWLADDIGAPALSRVLERLLADRAEIERVRRAGTIAARAGRLADPQPVLDAYEALAAELGERPAITATPAGTPLVTGVVPYYHASAYVSETVASLLAQTHAELEVLIVNDGSFEPEDAVLAELERDPRVTVVTKTNAGEGVARNLGALIAQGEYVVMLDADNLLEPRFVERALEAFRTEPELAYVTCWLRMIDAQGDEMPAEHGYAPLGNAVVDDDSRNWDGDAIAMFPRRLFTELGFGYGPEGSMHSDWELYRWLRQEGRFGTVLPERLARYRVLPGSLLHGHSEDLRERGWNESRTRNRARRTRWIATAPR